MSEPSDFGSFGRYAETPVGEMSAEMRDAYEFTKGLRGLVPGPHKIWLAKVPVRFRTVPGWCDGARPMMLRSKLKKRWNDPDGRWAPEFCSVSAKRAQFGQVGRRLPPDRLALIGPGGLEKAAATERPLPGSPRVRGNGGSGRSTARPLFRSNGPMAEWPLWVIGTR